MNRILAITLAGALLSGGAIAQDGPSRGVITLSGSDRAGACPGTLASGERYSYSPRPVYFVFSGLTYPVGGSTWTNASEPVAASTERLVTTLTGLKAGHGPVGSDGAGKPIEALFLETPGGRTILGPGVFTDVVRTRDGVLVGADGGEAGGALLYVRRLGKAEMLAAESTHAIFRIGGRVYAITGSGEKGSLWRVEEAGDVPKAVRIGDLPGGAPVAWAQVEESAFLVATASKAVSIRPGDIVKEIQVERGCVVPEATPK